MNVRPLEARQIWCAFGPDARDLLTKVNLWTFAKIEDVDAPEACCILGVARQTNGVCEFV